MTAISERRYPSNEELVAADLENEIGTVLFEEITVRGVEKAVAAAPYN